MNKSRRKLADANVFLDRIKKAYNLSSDAELARFLDTGTSSISTWRKRNSVKIGDLLSFVSELNTNWLLYGDNPMWKKDQLNDPDIVYESVQNKIDSFVLRAIAQLDAADVPDDEKKKIATGLLRLAREELAKIEREEKSND